MTKKLLNLTKIAVLVFAIGLLFNSCTEEKDVYIDNPTQWYNKQFNVKSSDWQWDKNLELYYADRDLSDLSKDIYEYGAVIGYVYIGEQGKDETMSVLPFLGADDNYARIWFDVSYDFGKSVRFYYQWNDYAQTRPANYNFKITMIY